MLVLRHYTVDGKIALDTSPDHETSLPFLVSRTDGGAWKVSKTDLKDSHVLNNTTNQVKLLPP